MILTVRPAFRCIQCRNFASVKRFDKLTADEIREAISRKDGKLNLRLVQIPGPPAPVLPDNIVDRIRYEKELAQWESVKDIRMPFETMCELLSQKDICKKRVVVNSAESKPKGITGYQLYMKENKHQLRTTLPKVPDGALACRQMCRAAASSWRSLPEEQKIEYRNRAAALKQESLQPAAGNADPK